MFHWHCINVFTWNTSQKNGTNDVQLRCFCWFQHNWYEFENRDGIKNTHTNRNSVCIHICLPSSMETLFRALFMDHIGAGSSHPIQESRCFRQLICLNAWGGSNSQFKTHKNFFFTKRANIKLEQVSIDIFEFMQTGLTYRFVQSVFALRRVKKKERFVPFC